MQFLSTQIEHPTQKSLQDLDRVVGYLSRTRGRGLRYTKVENLECYSTPMQRTPATSMQGTHWSSRRHRRRPRRAIMETTRRYTETKSCVLQISQAKLVSRSSTESELIAVHDTYPKLHWVNDLVREMSNLEMAILSVPRQHIHYSERSTRPPEIQ